MCRMYGFAIFCRRHSSTSSCHFVFANSTHESPMGHEGPSPARRAHPAFLTRLWHLSPSPTAYDSIASSRARHDPATPPPPAPIPQHLLAGASPAVQGSCPCSIGPSGAHPEVPLPSPASKPIVSSSPLFPPAPARLSSLSAPVDIRPAAAPSTSPHTHTHTRARSSTCTHTHTRTSFKMGN